MLELYKNIRNRRIELGLTQGDLAKKLGYADKSAIARIESGATDLGMSKVEAFARALYTTPTELMGWGCASCDEYYTDPEVVELAQEMYERPEMRVLFDASRNVTKEDIEQVAAILNKLGNK